MSIHQPYITGAYIGDATSGTSYVTVSTNPLTNLGRTTVDIAPRTVQLIDGWIAQLCYGGQVIWESTNRFESHSDALDAASARLTKKLIAMFS